jgi:glutamyl-tRNA synthetase
MGSPAPTGRLAPSPTGLLHLGHARTFLLAWWSARSRGGRVVLRIEDLDAGRVKPGMVEAALEDLAWLGLDWDGEPWVQSERAGAIDEAARELVERGLAYACVCTRKEIEAAASAPNAGEATLRYPGTCRGRFAGPEEAQRATGRAPALRLRVEPGTVLVDDRFAGASRHDVAAEAGDFAIALRAGAAAYQLAVVVDDARQGVDEVVRGDDLLPSAARQKLVQRALGLPHPAWYHVPLVVDETGRRFAKRSDDLSLARLRSLGVDPRAVVGWAARASGQAGDERASASELAPRFDFARVPRGPVVFGARELEGLLASRA